MPALGVCIIPEGKTITYKVNDNLNYYIQMNNGSTLILESNNGGNVNVNYNIWGPGSLNISCSVTAKASIGVAPSQTEIQGLPIYSYTQNTVEVL